MSEKADTSKEKKKKSRSKHVNVDGDYVDREVSRAMRQGTSKTGLVWKRVKYKSKMFEKADTSKEKKKKSRSKHVNVDGDYVDREVSRAMKQVEEAMSQVKMAEKEARRAKKEAKYMPPNTGISGVFFNPPQPGFTGVQDGGVHSTVTTTTHHGNYFHIQNCQNVQVGNNNTMIIKKGSKKSSRRRKSGSDDDDDDNDAAAERDDEATRAEKAELQKLPVFSSKRIVSFDDIDVICTKVSNWRRFLRFLNLEEANIDHVHEEYFHSGGVKEIIAQGIKMWKRKEAKGATINIVANALLKIDCFDGVRELQP